MKKLLHRFRLWLLKQKCMHLYRMTGKQYLVIPVDNWKRGKYTIVNNEIHKKYNAMAKKMGKPQINYVDLLKIAVFKSPTGTYKNATI